MARLNVEGFEEMELMIMRQEEAVERLAPEMLNAGAKVLAAAMGLTLRGVSRGNRSIGTLAGSIGIGTVKKSATSVYMDVYPQGDQPHGSPRKGKRGRVSNAQVGFMLEYGSSKMPARPWLAKAINAAAPGAQEAMRKVWEAGQDG